MKIEYFLTILTIIIGGFVAFVAYSQFILAREKFKLELFEKRFELYKNVESFLADILRDANVTIERKIKLYKDTQDAVFLFKDDIIKYLDEIQNKARELYVIIKKPLAEKEIDRETELLSWFADQITGKNPRLIEIFSPYLKFRIWK